MAFPDRVEREVDLSPFLFLSFFQTVALNGDQLRSFGGGYPPAACGKQITITYKGKTATATVQDECEFELLRSSFQAKDAFD